MSVFFSADTHFGHANIMAYAQRPFASAEEIDEALIANWNAVVGPRDEVWHLGDFALASDPDRYFRRLRGIKHLVVGNHDGDRVRRLPWASVHEMRMVRVGRDGVFCCHYPMRTWPQAHHGALHAFGHVHGVLRDSRRSCDVGVDRWGFTPVTLDAMLAQMAEAEPSPDWPADT